MTWLKYDGKPILIDKLANRKQPTELSAYTKPRGFWFTDNSEDCWRTWCLSERFCLENLTHKHELYLQEDRLLILNSEWEVTSFASQYNIDKWWGPTGEPRKYCDRCIDWPRVARKYAGIIITPYIWSLRLADRFSWYYGWDCASGCIWDVQAIKDIRLVEIDLDIAAKARPGWKPDEAAAQTIG